MRPERHGWAIRELKRMPVPVRVRGMKVLVVGKGGREHALVRAMKESPSAPEVFSFPGSDAIFELARPVPVDGLESLVSWMGANGIDLCVAGEESYLVKNEGLANLCERAGIPCWGPHKQSAQLEASKEFSKKFLLRHKIPTARATACGSLDEAMLAIGGVYPSVLKFDGLAAGKGVAVCPDEASALAFLDEVFTRRRFGDGRLLVEECLVGPEVSIFAAVVDDRYLIFTPARDYKRIGEGDQGPNEKQGRFGSAMEDPQHLGMFKGKADPYPFNKLKYFAIPANPGEDFITVLHPRKPGGTQIIATLVSSNKQASILKIIHGNTTDRVTVRNDGASFQRDTFPAIVIPMRIQNTTKE